MKKTKKIQEMEPVSIVSMRRNKKEMLQQDFHNSFPKLMI